MERVAVVLLVFALGACGSGDNSETSAAAETTSSVSTASSNSTSSTTTTTAPTTTTTAVLTTEEAGAEYLEVVAPFNCAAARLNDGWEATYPNGIFSEDWPGYLSQIRPLEQEVQDQAVAFVEQLVVTPWPSELQDDIDSLVTELSAWAGWLEEAVTATSYEQYFAMPPSPGAGSAATTLRAKLGLPSNVGSGAEDSTCDTA